MTEDELLKKCVDRGVADESSVGAVSHLFYMYLLSALQKGQRVEVPNFGTFGTRVVGVKRARKMPFFEPDADLADKVNERYKSLKYLVLGKYDLVAAVEETEYKGKEAPHDPTADQLGKEMVVDARHDVTQEQHEGTARRMEDLRQTKEKAPMAKFNLKDEGMEGEEQESPTPRLHEAEKERKGPGPLVQVLIAILLLGLLTFALQYFGIIHIWGPGATQPPKPAVTQQQPPPQPEIKPTPVPEPTPTPVPVEKPKPTRPSGTGTFTVQVSSWSSLAKANEEADRLVQAGFEAFVEDGVVDGAQWHRVRVGRYPTRAEANEAAIRLHEQLENGAWVTKVNS